MSGPQGLETIVWARGVEEIRDHLKRLCQQDKDSLSMDELDMIEEDPIDQEVKEALGDDRDEMSVLIQGEMGPPELPEVGEVQNLWGDNIPPITGEEPPQTHPTSVSQRIPTKVLEHIQDLLSQIRDTQVVIGGKLKEVELLMGVYDSKRT